MTFRVRISSSYLMIMSVYVMIMTFGENSEQVYLPWYNTSLSPVPDLQTDSCPGGKVLLCSLGTVLFSQFPPSACTLVPPPGKTLKLHPQNSFNSNTTFTLFKKQFHLDSNISFHQL